MATLVDSGLWIDFTRARTSRELKQFITPHVLAPGVVMAEPIVFEVFRFAKDEEIPLLHAQFQHVLVLPTPADIWSRGAELGQACRRNGISAGAMDLLISSVSLRLSRVRRRLTK